MIARNVAPHEDAVEVSIFGPGKGEALAIHLGRGNWMTVDSCRDQQTGVHPVLKYFSEIGVDPQTQVKLVLGTHAHDDHIAGMAELIVAAKSSVFVTSSAITSREFFAAVELDDDIDREVGQSVRREYRKVFAELSTRAEQDVSTTHLKRAVEGRDLLPLNPFGLDGVIVKALSPSDLAVSRALQALAEGTGRAGMRRKLSAVDPNEFSIALWIEAGGSSILLGADLLNGPGGCGWSAILDWFAPDKSASLIKVAHHGSPNAHHPQVWSTLLDQDVSSLVAPFRGGQTARPSPEDVSRICSLSSSAWITADPRGPSVRGSVKRVQAQLTGVASNVRERDGRVGQIRARRRPVDTEWSIDAFHPGRELRP